jgi:hypothetical protein
MTVENVSVSEVGRGALNPREYTPKWARRQAKAIQHPAPGTFDVQSLAWKTEEYNGKFYCIAAIPESRLDDFVHGEEQRGRTSLHSKVCRKGNLRIGIELVCKYGRPQHRRLQMRAKDPQHWDRAVGSGKKEDALRTECKLDCTYHFQVKGVFSVPDVVYILFAMGIDVPNGNAHNPMNHLNTNEWPVHAEG